MENRRPQNVAQEELCTKGGQTTLPETNALGIPDLNLEVAPVQMLPNYAVGVIDRPLMFAGEETGKFSSFEDSEAVVLETCAQPIEKLPFEDTVQFLVDTLEAGAALSLEGLRRDTQQMLRNGLYVLEQYFGHGKNGHEIADQLNITPSKVYQLKNRTLKELWQHSDPLIQLRYPIGALRLERPRTVERDMKISRGKGGRATKIAELAQQGFSSDAICDSLGISNSTLNKYRHILKRWGIDMPYVIEGFEVRSKIEQTIEDGKMIDIEAERLLGLVSANVFEGNSQGNNALFASVKQVAVKAGFRYSGNIAYKFYEELERAGIPLGKAKREIKGNKKPQTYLFILSLHMDRAIRTLQAYEGLDKYKISTNPESD